MRVKGRTRDHWFRVSQTSARRARLFYLTGDRFSSIVEAQKYFYPSFCCVESRLRLF